MNVLVWHLLRLVSSGCPQVDVALAVSQASHLLAVDGDGVQDGTCLPVVNM